MGFNPNSIFENSPGNSSYKRRKSSNSKDRGQNQDYSKFMQLIRQNSRSKSRSREKRNLELESRDQVGRMFDSISSSKHNSKPQRPYILNENNEKIEVPSEGFKQPSILAQFSRKSIKNSLAGVGSNSSNVYSHRNANSVNQMNSYQNSLFEDFNGRNAATYTKVNTNDKSAMNRRKSTSTNKKKTDKGKSTGRRRLKKTKSKSILEKNQGPTRTKNRSRLRKNYSMKNSGEFKFLRKDKKKNLSRSFSKPRLSSWRKSQGPSLKKSKSKYKFRKGLNSKSQKKKKPKKKIVATRQRNLTFSKSKKNLRKKKSSSNLRKNQEIKQFQPTSEQRNSNQGEIFGSIEMANRKMFSGGARFMKTSNEGGVAVLEDRNTKTMENMSGFKGFFNNEPATVMPVVVKKRKVNTNKSKSKSQHKAKGLKKTKSKVKLRSNKVKTYNGEARAGKSKKSTRKVVNRRKNRDVSKTDSKSQSSTHNKSFKISSMRKPKKVGRSYRKNNAK